ncbi:uncharacterized protein MELLADRAFT_104887 [Melampsora larici-populina 98AG31]|uniref:Secreted protein n=1 Tax=Melampsora larici-populina (strain 98AG31 / pathotype 3-4-7) TaxID=747676 RepID=F4RGE0_MELLP|nr:uncharacterized protein MELLADRAFT_104887 [Melampsora larici-populina 98AG31]EGG08666.1 hypothetical protein MELLADRAFT_104887 [Melampsora larici-populina 98AG31]
MSRKMKTLLALLLLALNITSSRLMHCGMPVDADTDYLKMLEAHNSVPTAKTVNGASFLADDVHLDGNGIDVERRQKFKELHPPSKNTPYADFFKQSRSIRQQTKNEELAQMAIKVLNMISKLKANDVTFGNWLRKSDAVDCFELAHKAFNSKSGCEKNERLWAAGILAAILDHLPNIDGMTAEKYFENFNWSNQVKEDIQAAKDIQEAKTKALELAEVKDSLIAGVQINSGLKLFSLASILFRMTCKAQDILGK